MSPTLLHLNATLLQAFFPAPQDHFSLMYVTILGVPKWGQFFLILKIHKKIAFCLKQKLFWGMSF